MIRFHCVHCGSAVEAEDVYAGQLTRCPSCNNDVSIPGGTGQSPPPPLPHEDEPWNDTGGLAQDRPGRGRAIAALVLGIIAVGIPGFGFLAVPLAIVFGILGISGRSAYKGMAVAGLVLGVAAIFTQALLISILLPSLTRAREHANRAVCAANLRGLGQAIAMYSEENRRQSPHIKRSVAEWGTRWDADASVVDSIEQLATQANETGVNLQHWWLLVHSGQVSAGQFRCPSGDATETAWERGSFGFRSWGNVSYALPLQTRHVDNQAYVRATGQPGAVVWAADITPRTPGSGGAAENHRNGFNYLSANYAVRFHSGDSHRVGYEDDDIFQKNTGLGSNDSYLVWRPQ